MEEIYIIALSTNSNNDLFYTGCGNSEFVDYPEFSESKSEAYSFYSLGNVFASIEQIMQFDDTSLLRFEFTDISIVKELKPC